MAGVGTGAMGGMGLPSSLRRAAAYVEKLGRLSAPGAPFTIGALVSAAVNGGGRGNLASPACRL